MSSLIFTNALADNCRDIAEIESECFSQPWSESALSDFLSFGFNSVLCAYVKEKLCGYVSYSTILDEVQIANVAVSVAFRRRHIAKQLIEKLICDSKKLGVSVITLEVRQSNTPALQLYQKCGFSRVGLRRNYYSHPNEDAVIMSINFSNTLPEGTHQ